MAVSIADIQKLRKMTGAGLADCKKALTEADGDIEKAIEAVNSMKEVNQEELEKYIEEKEEEFGEKEHKI